VFALRTRVTEATSRAAVIAALLALVMPAVGAAGPTRLTSLERAVLVAVNRVRAEHGRPPLQIDPRLVRAARRHTDSMVATGAFDHGRFWVWIEGEGIRSGRLGEALGWRAPVNGAESRVVAMWMRSPDHRPILLDGAYQAVGIGVRLAPFKGHRNAFVVTADFRGPA
jgi:uncharacterized protein YkwD